MSPEQCIEPTLAMRLKLALVAIGAIALATALSLWLEPRLLRVTTLPTCEALPWVRLELVAAWVASWLLAFVAFRRALAISRAGQFPTPGTWVWARTIVRRGAAARANAVFVCCVAAVLALGPPVVFLAFGFHVLFCIPQACGC